MQTQTEQGQIDKIAERAEQFGYTLFFALRHEEHQGWAHLAADGLIGCELQDKACYGTIEQVTNWLESIESDERLGIAHTVARTLWQTDYNDLPANVQKVCRDVALCTERLREDQTQRRKRTMMKT
ncbi:MAG: hypothetical protein ACRENK_09370 [Gemmatimonadaceae bacterium]